MSTVEVPSSTDLQAMSRAELDALATELGLDPAEYTNKALIIQAIEGLREGDTQEVVAATEEAGVAEYPPYMGDMFERDLDANPVEEPITGLQMLPLYDVFGEPRNPRWGDDIAFNTDEGFVKTTTLRVTVVNQDTDEDIPLFQAEVPAYPMRTPFFTLGPSPLWTEHTRYGGAGRAVLVSIDPDHGGETEGVSIDFVVEGGEAPADQFEAKDGTDEQVRNDVLEAEAQAREEEATA